MKFRRKLQNPFLLIGEGFLAGAILFFAFHHQSSEARSFPSIGAESTIKAATTRP